MNTNRPASKSQKSRKGKKAWRKNIDLDHLEQDMEDRRDTEIVLGPSGALFEVDTKAHEEGLTSAMRQEKQLKSQEILYKRSAIPGLVAPHKKKDATKSKVKVHDLVKKAGRNGEDAQKARLEQDGLNRGRNLDLWDTPSTAEEPIKSIKRKILEGPHAPIRTEVSVALPHGGKSYNPSQDSWKDLIINEHAKLERIEREQELLNAEQERIQALIRKYEEKEAGDEDEQSSGDDEVEEFDGRLSVNAPAKNKKKTKQQRARAQKQRQQEELHKRLKELNKLRAELEKIKPDDLAHLKPGEPKPKKYRGLKGKHSIMDPALEVKLSDEIEGSLRRLRPEGNIAQDRFRSLQARGIIEARVPVKNKRRYAKRVTEKWSYKDFNKTRPHGQ